MGAGGAEGRRGLQRDRPLCGLLQVPGLVQGSRGDVMGSSPWLSSAHMDRLLLGSGPRTLGSEDPEDPQALSWGSRRAVDAHSPLRVREAQSPVYGLSVRRAC